MDAKTWLFSPLAFVSLVVSMAPARATRLHQEDGILPNHSAEYVRTLNRNASTSTDAAFYNPAGLAFMRHRGLHIMFSGQTYWVRRLHTQDYYGIDVNDGGNRQTSHTMDSFVGNVPEEYSAEALAPILPDLDIVYKEDNWAAFFDVSVMQAAPPLVFSDGLAIMDWGNLAALETGYYTSDSEVLSHSRDAEAARTEYYVAGTVGGSYAVLDWLSVGLGARYIHARGNQYIRIQNASTVTSSSDLGSSQTFALGDWHVDTDTEGHGFGLILGLHFKPTERMNIGVRYEYYAPLVMKKITNKFLVPEVIEKSGKLDILKDGRPGADMEYLSGNGTRTLHVTYPQAFSLGLSHQILEDLRAEVSGELSLRPFRDLDGREDQWKIGFRAGGCLEWMFLPGLKASLGYLYNDFGIKPKERTEVDPLLTSHTIGGGVDLEVSDRLSVSLGAFYMLFVPEELYYTDYTNITAPTDHHINKSFDEKRLSVAIDFTYRFFGDAAEI